jgi:hypothetical protein
MGIETLFDFSFVEKMRKEHLESPGNISTFIDWFFNKSKILDDFPNNKTVNVLCVTHAGVLSNFIQRGVLNNGAVVLGGVDQNKLDIVHRVPQLFLMKKKFDLDLVLLQPKIQAEDYLRHSRYKYLCPSTRCSGLCDKLQNNSLLPSFLSNKKELKLPKWRRGLK